MALALTASYKHAVGLSVLLVLTFRAPEVKACGDPVKVENAKVTETLSSQTNLRYIRYTCVDGYKRKAGTSNLAICKFNSTTKQSHWEYTKISCIRDPSVPLTTPSALPSSTIPGSSSSPDLISPSTEETFTTKLQTSESAITVPGHTPTTTTESYYSTLEHITYSPGTTSSPNIASTSIKERFTTPKLQTSKEAITIPGHTKATTTESYHSTLDPTTNSADAKIWTHAQTAGTITTPLLIILFIIGAVVVYKMRSRREHDPVPQEERASQYGQRGQDEETTL